MIIAIIDDGVYEGYFDVGNLKYDIEISTDGTVMAMETSESGFMSHGTMCAAIIKKHAPEVEICSIKVLNQRDKGTLLQLLSALDWCYENRIPLIHMSLGSVYYKDFDKIQKSVARLTRNGAIIVAAKNNNNEYTVPACLSNVFGVASCVSYDEGMFSAFESCSNDIKFLASGRRELTDINGENHKIPASNSYAAPVVTACVHNLIIKNCTGFYNIYHALRENSTGRERKAKIYQTNIDFIDEAYVINLSDTYLHDSFCFDLISVYSTENIHLFHTDELRINLVLIYKENNIHLIKDSIRLYAGRIKGLILCGDASRKGLKEFIDYADFLIWDEKEYTRHINNVCAGDISGQELSVPAVCICGDRNCVMEVSQKFYEVLYDRGYFVKRFSDFEYSYLFGYDFIPKAGSIDNLVHFIYNKTKFDMLIFASDTVIQDSMMDFFIKFDMERMGVLIAENQIIIGSQAIHSLDINMIVDYFVKYFDK